MKKLNLLLAIGILISTFSCRKEYDSPPVQNLPLGNILTIEELKAFRDSVGAAYTFTEDYSVYATATTDESSGNFYKEVYVQAGNHAIQLRLANAGGLYEGDSIRIYLKGTTIDIYRGMFQLDGVDVDNNGIIQTIVEKDVISNEFCCGGYGFSDAEKFVQTYDKLKNSAKGEIYVSHIIFQQLLDIANKVIKITLFK